MGPSTTDAVQGAYFDVESNQYARAAVLQPPLHTKLELETVLDRLAGLETGTQVADFGAGTGRLSIPLARVGYAVLAVDISDRSLDALRGIASHAGLDGIETVRELPCAGRLPAIVGADVLHHVDLGECLPRIRASLRSDGRVVFSEPGALNPAWYPFLLLRHDLRIERRIVYNHVWGLRRAFERHGFCDVRIAGLGLLPRPLFRFRESICRRNDAAGNMRVLRWFAYRYIVEARIDGRPSAAAPHAGRDVGSARIADARPTFAP